ncbi:hypothetical protein [Devosia sp. SL43]|uniref:hypothetical protein n=1 Tax=Devosia sp. SL43 TaxID=2806348 RepID=UPI001F2831B0|nr:hypothetical protein [Devosia sp. SL43]UJW87904.1 hypothetical protein IM737_20700 [Devosia sp. SL43]
MSGDGTLIFKRLGADLDAKRNGSALDQFFAALRQVDTEYGRADISATAAMAEVRAALRQLDRHQTINRGKRA